MTRAHKGWALDSVVLHNEVIKISKEEIEDPPSEGVYVYGLFIDGGGWDKRNSRLTEQQNKVIVYSLIQIKCTEPLMYNNSHLNGTF